MMIVKEKDSFQYYCPQTIAAGADNAFNCCKGSSCMAWRWATEQNPEFKVKDYVPFGNNPEPFIRSKTHGYCGMAGGA